MTWQSDFFEIDLDKVPTPQLDPTWLASHGYSRADMQTWLHHLADIQRLKRDHGLGETDFRLMLQSPDADKRAMAETYHKFYDHEPTGARVNGDFIKVDWRNGGYDVTNGRHRIWLAKRMGLSYLPAYVSAPDERTLTKLRAEGELLVALRGLEHQKAREPWENRNDPGSPRRTNRERG